MNSVGLVDPDGPRRRDARTRLSYRPGMGCMRPESTVAGQLHGLCYIHVNSVTSLRSRPCATVRALSLPPNHVHKPPSTDKLYLLGLMESRVRVGKHHTEDSDV